MNLHTRHAVPFTAVAAALLAAFGPALASDPEEIARLTKPESTVNFGLGYVDRDNQRFGQYTGLRKQDPYGLLDLDLVRRDDATGTWLKFTGRNLGLDNRELRFEHDRQGDWGYFIEFSQTPRYNPYTVNTRLLGIGTSVQSINAPGTVQQPVQLKTQREAFGLGFDKIFMGNFNFQVRFRNEEKDGARQFGQGTQGTINFLTDPINQTTRQLEVSLGYTGDKLQLSGGYYGTAFDNHNAALNVTGGIAGQAPLALPPGNQSHQLHLAGGYSFTPTTRGTFKVAYTHLTQNDAFMAPSIVGRTDLGGRLDTTLVQLGLTARPMPKLALLANLRYEDRDDKTPIARYFTTGITGTSTLDGSNEPRSLKSTTGKLEASYALPMDFRLTGGIDHEVRKRNTYRVRSVSHRDETEETSYRAELRRSISETVTGALAYVHSDRDGSPFLLTVLNNNTAGSNLISPIHLADRKRDKVRLSVNWMPIEPLSLQFFVDEARDSYSARTTAGLGPRSGKARNYSVDAAYTFSEKWQATAWISRNDLRADQATQCVAVSGGCTTPAPGQLWAARLRNVGDAYGIGVRGKPYAWLELGADVSHSDIKDEYRQQALTGAPITSLPDVSTKLTTLKLFAKYAVQKNAGVRLDYVYDRWSSNDWAWTTFTYSDGTRITQDPNQKVNFIGVSYYYRFQ